MDSEIELEEKELTLKGEHELANYFTLVTPRFPSR